MKLKTLLILLIALLLFSSFKLPKNKGQNILIFKMHNSIKTEYATEITIKSFKDGKTYKSSWVDYFRKYCILKKVPEGKYYVTKILYMAGNYSSWITFEFPYLILEVDESRSLQYFGAFEISKEKIIKANEEVEKVNINQLDKMFNYEFKDKGWQFNSDSNYTPMMITFSDIKIK